MIETSGMLKSALFLIFCYIWYSFSFCSSLDTSEDAYANESAKYLLTKVLFT